jgi:hypothetical protein
MSKGLHTFRMWSFPQAWFPGSCLQRRIYRASFACSSELNAVKICVVLLVVGTKRGSYQTAETARLESNVNFSLFLLLIVVFRYTNVLIIYKRGYVKLQLITAHHFVPFRILCR